MESNLSKYNNGKSMRQDLYQAYLDCCNVNNDFNDHPHNLTNEQKRYITKTLEQFERNGLKLDQDKRNQLLVIQNKISDLLNEFGKNISNDKSKLSFTIEQLNGLPNDVLESLEKDTNNQGNYYVSLKFPEIRPCMKYCKLESTRKQLSILRFNKCNEINTPIIESILKLRYQQSQVLGYPNWASFRVSNLMVKSNENIQIFEERMRSLFEPHAKLELDKLTKLKEKYCNYNSLEYYGTFNIWDTEFFNNQILLQEYQIDTNIVKEYFQLEFVLNGAFDIFQELLSVKFTEIVLDQSQSWHKDVKYYSVSDTAENNKLMGYFYTDLTSRPFKYSHSAVASLISKRGDHQLPVSVMLCNFSKPTLNKPSLLTHDEVVTFFHEFGHVMHNISSKVNYSKFSSVLERDFVECPSQLFECFAYSKQLLINRLSGHYLDNSKKLPEELVDKLISSKNLNISLYYLRQIHLALFDNTIHSGNGEVDTATLFHEMGKNIALLTTPEGTNQTASFGHLTGYDAQYYSYLYSVCFAACIFEKFEQTGNIINKELGKQLRDKLLSVGGSQDSQDTIESFLGGKPDESVFLKNLKLI